MPNKNWLSVEAEGENALRGSKTRKAVLAYLRTKHRISKFSSVVEELVDDYVLYGMAFAMTYYVNKNPNKDNNNNQYSSNYSGPVTRRISPYDIVFNPTAANWESTPKIVRSLKSMAALIREAEDNPADGWKLEAIEKLKNNRTYYQGMSTEDIHKAQQLKVDGFGTWADYVKSDNVEVLDLYGDVYDPTTQTLYRDYVVTVVDRSIVARSMPLDTWTGRPYIEKAGWRSRKDNLWAMGPLENLVGLQYRINHLENARADAFDDMIYGDLVVTGNVLVETNPDGSMTYIVPEGGNVRRLAPDTTILNADLQIDETERKMELYAGAPREAAGIRTPGEKTKFEVNLLSIAAGRIFQHKMSKFEVELLEKTVNNQIMVSRENMARYERVRVDENSGIASFLEVNKEDLFMDGTLVPIGARYYGRKNQLAQELLTFNTQVLPSDKELAQHFPSKRLAKAWEDVLGFEEFEMYEEYGRIAEQVEAQQLSMAGQRQVQGEQAAAESDLQNEGGIIG
jgi:hypothetical protein